MSNAVKPKISLSLWRVARFILTFLAGSAITPGSVDALLPPGVADLTVSAALAGVLNYLKVKFNWKF